MSSTFPFELGRFFRQSDPITSRKSVTKTNRIHWKSQCYQLLRAYANSDLTDEEAAQRSGVLTYARSWWRRCSDLRQKGLIQPTGEERTSSAGSPQMVCRITRRGLALIEQEPVTN